MKRSELIFILVVLAIGAVALALFNNAFPMIR